MASRHDETAGPGIGWVVAAGVASAVLFFFGTGLTPIAALTWLAPLPVLLLAPRIPARTALALAFLAFLASTSNSFAYYSHSYDVPLPMGIGISLGYSLTFMLSVWLFRALVRKGHLLLATLSAPAAWVSVLYLVSVTSPMGISGTLAGTQAAAPVLLQTASVTGAWGVEYLILLAPTAIAALCAPGLTRALRIRTGAIVSAVFTLVVAGGVLRLSTMEVLPAQRIAMIVHDRAGWGVDLATADGRRLLDSYLAQIAALPTGVTLALLPEGAFKVDDGAETALAQAIAPVAREHGITVVAGYVRWARGQKFNEALVVPGGGGDPVRYLKHHDTVSPPGHDLVFVPGASTPTGVQICADVNFPDPSRDYAKAGARMVVIPAADNNEDGWQHAHTGLLRGVENGLSVLWAGRYGTLMAADGSGRILAERHVGDADAFTTVVAEVRPGPGVTAYSRFGDWFAWGCLALTILAIAAHLLRRKENADH